MPATPTKATNVANRDLNLADLLAALRTGVHCFAAAPDMACVVEPSTASSPTMPPANPPPSLTSGVMSEVYEGPLLSHPSDVASSEGGDTS